jgi:hypothetical protein
MIRLLKLSATPQPMRFGWGVRRWFGWFAIAAITLVVVGHGCHGDEVDHEPTVFPLTSEDRESTRVHSIP